MWREETEERCARGVERNGTKLAGFCFTRADLREIGLVVDGLFGEPQAGEFWQMVPVSNSARRAARGSGRSFVAVLRAGESGAFARPASFLQGYPEASPH